MPVPPSVVNFLLNEHQSAEAWETMIAATGLPFERNKEIVVSSLVLINGNYEFTLFGKDHSVSCYQFFQYNYKIKVLDELYIRDVLYSFGTKQIQDVVNCGKFVFVEIARDVPLNMLKLMAPNIRSLKVLGDAEFVDEIQETIPIEEVAKAFPSLKKLQWSFIRNFGSMTADTNKKLAKLPSLKLMERISFSNLDGNFTFQPFADFMLQNKKIKFYLSYTNGISNEYKEMLVTFCKEMEKLHYRDGKGESKPEIYFPSKFDRMGN